MNSPDPMRLGIILLLASQFLGPSGIMPSWRSSWAAHRSPGRRGARHDELRNPSALYTSLLFFPMSFWHRWPGSQ